MELALLLPDFERVMMLEDVFLLVLALVAVLLLDLVDLLLLLFAAEVSLGAFDLSSEVGLLDDVELVGALVVVTLGTAVVGVPVTCYMDERWSRSRKHVRHRFRHKKCNLNEQLKLTLPVGLKLGLTLGDNVLTVTSPATTSTC